MEEKIVEKYSLILILDLHLDCSIMGNSHFYFYRSPLSKFSIAFSNPWEVTAMYYLKQTAQVRKRACMKSIAMAKMVVQDKERNKIPFFFILRDFLCFCGWSGLLWFFVCLFLLGCGLLLLLYFFSPRFSWIMF